MAVCSDAHFFSPVLTHFTQGCSFTIIQLSDCFWGCSILWISPFPPPSLSCSLSLPQNFIFCSFYCFWTILNTTLSSDVKPNSFVLSKLECDLMSDQRLEASGEGGTLHTCLPAVLSYSGSLVCLCCFWVPWNISRPRSLMSFVLSSFQVNIICQIPLEG